MGGRMDLFIFLWVDFLVLGNSEMLCCVRVSAILLQVLFVRSARGFRLLSHLHFGGRFLPSGPWHDIGASPFLRRAACWRIEAHTASGCLCTFTSGTFSTQWS